MMNYCDWNLNVFRDTYYHEVAFSTGIRVRTRGGRDLAPAFPGMHRMALLVRALCQSSPVAT